MTTGRIDYSPDYKSETEDAQLERELREVMVRRGELIPTTEAEVAAAELAQAGEYCNGLARRVVEVCEHRGWSLHWTHRGAYLHLESSELIEAVRGKRSSVLEEAGDVLFVLMSITQNAGVPFTDVLEQAERKASGLMTKPHYAGEEHDGAAL